MDTFNSIKAKIKKSSWKKYTQRTSRHNSKQSSTELKQSTTPTSQDTYATLDHRPQFERKKANDQWRPRQGKPHSKSVGYVDEHIALMEGLDHLKQHRKTLPARKFSAQFSGGGGYGSSDQENGSEEKFLSDPNVRDLQRLSLTVSISAAFDVDTSHTDDEKNQINKHDVYDMDEKKDESSVMWKPQYFVENIWTKDCEINAFKDCFCIQRLVFVMRYYNASENRANKYSPSEMKQVITKLSVYDNVMLLNDYNHIKEKHYKNNDILEESDDEEKDLDHDENKIKTHTQKLDIQANYAMIHEYFAELCLDSEPCEPDFCACLKRNFRDRAKCTNDDKYRRDLYSNRLSQNEDNGLNIVSKQLLDTIHCFIFHPQMRNNIEKEKRGKRHILRPITISHYEQSFLMDDEIDDKEHESTMNRYSHKYKRSTLMSDAKSFRHTKTMSKINFTIDDLLTPIQTKKKLFIKQKTTTFSTVENLQNIFIDITEAKEKEEPLDEQHEQPIKPRKSNLEIISKAPTFSSLRIPSIGPTMPKLFKLVQQEQEQEKKQQELKQQQQQQQQEEIHEEPSYEFGIKMIYDKDNIEGKQNVFNINKNSNFHDELLNNKIMSISQEQWQGCMKKALLKIATVRGRHIIGKRGHFHGKKMTVDHVMAILLYCNFDELQRKFRSTFRKNDPKETNDDVRHRHGNYYWWGKHLNEAIFCFGDDIKSKDICIYHGLQQKLLFSEFSACFYSPLSTTPSLNVANTFQGHSENNNGIIIKLVRSQDYSAYYLNVSWLSDFCDEEERLFACSHKGFYLNIYSIIYDNTDYRKYIASLNLFDQIINPDFFISYDCKPKKNHQKRLIQMIKHQLKQNKKKKKNNKLKNNKKHLKQKPLKQDDHEETDFIDELIDGFCSKKQSIGISLETDDLSVFTTKFAEYLVNLTISGKIFLLFPAMEQLLIEYIEFNDKQLIKFMDNFIQTLPDIEENKQEICLHSVMFADINVESDNKIQLREMMEKIWPNRLESKGWNIRMNDKYPGRMELINVINQRKRVKHSLAAMTKTAHSSD